MFIKKLWYSLQKDIQEFDENKNMIDVMHRNSYILYYNKYFYKNYRHKN